MSEALKECSKVIVIVQIKGYLEGIVSFRKIEVIVATTRDSWRAGKRSRTLRKKGGKNKNEKAKKK